MMGQQGNRGQYVVKRMGGNLQIVPVEAPRATDLPANLDVLAIVHPET